MKARRSMQITVGWIALIIAAALVLSALAFTVMSFLPQQFEQIINIPATLLESFTKTAADWGIADYFYLLPAIAYGLPTLLLVIAAALELSRDKGKQGKYVAGCMLTLIGVTIVALYTVIVLATEVMQGNGALVLRCSVGGLFALTALFCALALGLPRGKKAQQQVAETTAATSVEQPTAEETAQSPAANDSAADYVPEEVSVKETLDEVYGEEPAHISDSKLSTLRMLLDMGAISDEEYLKLLESYLK